MSVCLEGHVLDEGKALCSRCNQPAKAEIAEVKPEVKEEPKEELSLDIKPKKGKKSKKS